MGFLRLEHLITLAVAGGCFGLALAEGGFAPTAFAATGLAVWLAIVIGIATGLVPRDELPVPAVATGLCLAVLAGLVAVSMTWAADDGQAFEDAVKALAYLGVFALVVVGSRRGDARPWLWGLAIGLVGIGAIALLARFQPDLLGDPDAELAAGLPAVLGRLTYPIGYWNGLAAMMAAAIVLLTFLGVGAGSRAARALAVGALPIALLALWMTDSRGGLLAASLAFLILLATFPGRTRLVANLGLGSVGGAALITLAEAREELLNDPLAAVAAGQGDAMLAFTVIATVLTGIARFVLDERLGRVRVSPRLGRGALAVGAIAILAAIVVADPVERYEEFKQPPTAEELADGEVGLLRGGGSGRYQFWEAAADAFADAPAKGLGAGGYGPYWLENREIPLQATRAHSVAIEALAELGLGGLALILGFFAIPTVVGVRRLRAGEAVTELAPALALLGVGAAAAAVDWTWDLPAVFVPTLIAAGLLAGPATLPSANRARLVPVGGIAPSRRRFARGVAVLLLAWISICAAGLLLLADDRLGASREAGARGETARAIDIVGEAIDLQPWAAAPRTQLAVLREDAGDLEGARDALDEAIARARDDFELYLVATRLDLAAGDDAAASEHLGRAIELNPLDPRLGPLIGLEPSDPAVQRVIGSSG